MNVRTILRFAAAIGAIVAAAPVVIVAASFALYALAKDYIGAAGAAAVVAGVFALVAVIIALIATRKAVPPRRKNAPPELTPMEQAIRLAKERPLIALGAVAAAAVVAVRNPGLITALVGAFAAGRESKPDKPR